MSVQSKIPREFRYIYAVEDGLDISEMFLKDAVTCLEHLVGAIRPTGMNELYQVESGEELRQKPSALVEGFVRRASAMYERGLKPAIKNGAEPLMSSYLGERKIMRGDGHGVNEKRKIVNEIMKADTKDVAGMIVHLFDKMKPKFEKYARLVSEIHEETTKITEMLREAHTSTDQSRYMMDRIDEQIEDEMDNDFSELIGAIWATGTDEIFPSFSLIAPAFAGFGEGPGHVVEPESSTDDTMAFKEQSLQTIPTLGDEFSNPFSKDFDAEDVTEYIGSVDVDIEAQAQEFPWEIDREVNLGSLDRK